MVPTLPTRRWLSAMLLLAFVLPLGACASRDRTSAPAPSEMSRSSFATRSDAQPAPPPPSTAPIIDAVPAAPPVRVLFIGNSYTFHNGGVDAVLQALARAAGRNFECAASVSGGKSLQWHWEEGDARAQIARGGWDYVVLQELSTRPIANPELMLEYARKFDAAIKSAGAHTVFFLTWARYHQPEKQRPITRAYNKVAFELAALVAPVGPAFERVLDEHPSIRLHAEDRSHPTAAGTYLAACVFYATLTEASPVGLPATITTASGKTITLDRDTAEVLQRAAQAAVARSKPTQIVE